jgi:hypothetical protein
MNAVRAVIREIAGLFFDDGWLGIGLLIWVGLCAIGFPSLNVPSTVEAPIFGMGCVGILVASVMRRASKR